MTFWAYMLRCADGRFYVGHTDNLEGRMSQHQHGGYCDFTTRRRPVALAWSQEFATPEEALTAERQLKGWTRAKKEALIRGDWATISWLAIPPRNVLRSGLIVLRLRSGRTVGGRPAPSADG